jgi:hypothetical protein
MFPRAALAAVENAELGKRRRTPDSDVFGRPMGYGPEGAGGSNFQFAAPTLGLPWDQESMLASKDG